MDVEDLEIEDDEEPAAAEAADEDEATADGAKATGDSAEDAPAADDDEIAEPSEKDKASGDFVWDEEESEALRQARKDAELTALEPKVKVVIKP